jgi:hypothetical protein
MQLEWTRRTKAPFSQSYRFFSRRMQLNLNFIMFRRRISWLRCFDSASSSESGKPRYFNFRNISIFPLLCPRCWIWWLMVKEIIDERFYSETNSLRHVWLPWHGNKCNSPEFRLIYQSFIGSNKSHISRQYQNVIVHGAHLRPCIHL